MRFHSTRVRSCFRLVTVILMLALLACASLFAQQNPPAATDKTGFHCGGEAGHNRPKTGGHGF
jgi:hypothetical protein